MSGMLVDAHVHVVSARKAALLGSRGGLERLAHPLGIPELRAEQPHMMRAVVMESDRPFPGEDAALLALAARHPDLVAAVIGRLELTRRDFADRLAEIDEHPFGMRWRGPRLVLRADIAQPWNTALVRARTGLLAQSDRVLELLATADRLDAAHDIARAAECLVVLDHLGFPPWDGDDGQWTAWEASFTALAAVPTVVTKLSALPGPTASGRAAERRDRACLLALELFGDDRLMYASNWPWPPPVGEQDELYPMSTAIAATRDLGAAWRDGFFGETAARVFRIEA